MSEEQSLQSNCQLCGGLLEFPSEWIGAQVACPLCGGTTELRVESLEVEEVPLEEEFAAAPPKPPRRWAAVISLIIGVALFLGSLGAWILWKQYSAAKVEVTKSSSPTFVEEGVVVVAPMLAMYQGGVKAEELRLGCELFVGRCSECHNPHDPATYSAGEWGSIFSTMRGKAKLSGEEVEQINRFLASVRP